MKNKIYSIFAAVLAAVIALPSSLVLPETVFADGENITETTETTPTALPKRIMNGSFEQPAITYDELQTYDVYNKEHTSGWTTDGLWYLKTPNELNGMATDNRGKDISEPGFYWQTTSFRNKVEMVLSNLSREDYRQGDNAKTNEYCDANNGPYFYTEHGTGKQYCFKPYLNYNNQTLNVNLWMKDGKQCAELVPEDQSSLYQNVSTNPGARLSWALSHRARTEGITDAMALFIGPVHDDRQMKKINDKKGSKDIFMWMAELLKNKGIVPDFENNKVPAGSIIPCVVYLDPSFELSEIKADNYKNYVSLTPTATINEKWSCWIMASDVENWSDYAGKYDVPEGQTETTFAFTALNGKKNGNIDAELNEGNLLDDIRFSITYPLLVTSTSGGSGTVEAQGKDADGNDVTAENTVVNVNTNHNNDYVDGTKVTVSATANEKDGEQEFVFIGANVDGVYVPAKNGDGTANTVDYTVSGNKYSLNLTMDNPHVVQLIFIAKGKITYDPNGGTYNGNTKPTTVSMSANGKVSDSFETTQTTISDQYQTWYNPIGDAVPSNIDNMKFIGWYFARGKQSENSATSGALIESAHKVEYVSATDNSTDDNFNVTYKTDSRDQTDTISVKEGVTFVAQYEYLQQDIAQTANGTDGSYQNSKDGGTVTLSIKDFATSLVEGKNIEDTDCGQKGFGRLRDTVTMTATANTDYTFMGWYDKETKDGQEEYNLIQRGKTLVYNVDKAHTYYARFKKNDGVCYVSFVAESTAIPMPSDTPFADGSHVRGYTHTSEDNTSTKYNRIYNKSITERVGGNDWFGNTISTGFTVSKAVDGTASKIQWTITVPTDSAEDKNLDTYVKIREGSTTSLFPRKDEKVLEDTVTQSSYFNKGAIYKVDSAAVMPENEITGISSGDAIWEYYGLGGVGNAVGDSDISSDETDFIDEENGGADAAGDISDEVSEFEPVPEEDFGVFEDLFAAELNLANLDENGNVVIKLERNIGTEVSGGATLVYGLVIDNLYAPRATVDISFGSDNTTFQDIGSKSESLSSEGFRQDSKNPYKDYEIKKSQTSN